MLQFRLSLFAMLAAGISQAAVSQLSCSGTAQQAVIRSEGLAERLGDIVLRCQANVPGGEVISSVQVVLSAPVANGGAAQLTIERAGVVVQTLEGQASGTNIVSFPALATTLDATGQTTIRISNLRADATGRAGQQITALIGTTGATGLGVLPNPVTPGVVQPGLLVNSTVSSIVCVGSPVPSEEPLTLGALFSAGTAVSTLRATEGSSDAFQTRLSGATTGTRLLVQLSGFPAGARVFLPTVIAGSSATQPTSAGDLGLARSGGRYTPMATGSLLLAQVTGANANGVGGNALFQPSAPGSGTVVLLGAREVVLNYGTGTGAGTAVFEVVDGNSTVIESAQVPVFVSLPANSAGRGTIAQAKVVLGPISTAVADTPRFGANQNPGLDCTVLNDCDAGYFPHLEVDAPALDFTAPPGSKIFLSKRVIVRNTRGGLMPWTARWIYQNGTGWLNVVSNTGVNQAAFQLDLNQGVIREPDVYRATLIIDAGPLAGAVQLPVTYNASGVASDTLPLVSDAGNAANPNLKILVPGSRAVLQGLRFPAAPTVTFNGIAAQVIAAGPERIEVVVPAALGAATSAQTVVGSGALTSPAFDATLAASAPAIYPGAIFNQNNSPNSATAPEQTGRVLQVFLTGLPVASGLITANLQGELVRVPIREILYAGEAPGYAGVQQVNLRLPAALPAGGTELAICGLASNNVEVCNAPVRVYLQRP